jgi:protoporphyrinogen oxidase
MCLCYRRSNGNSRSPRASAGTPQQFRAVLPKPFPKRPHSSGVLVTQTEAGGASPAVDTDVLIMGAGPAGLTAAYELSKNGVPRMVIEADNVVGGIARTANYKEYLFDIGGHRFFTKVTLVEQMWKEVLGDDLITRPRASRIYYRRKFFQYPLEPMNALFGLGILEAARCGLSYTWSQFFKARPEEDFETWVSNRFGRRLFQIFFKTYTEKVWGMPCNQIKAEWAAQRIKDLSLFSLVWNAIRPRGKQAKADVIKTLIHEFQYPRKGPSMMWERTRDIVEQRGATVMMNTPVERIRWRPARWNR